MALQRPTLSVMDAHIKALQRLRHYQLTLIELQLRSEAANDPTRKAQLQAALALLKNDIRQYEPTKHLLKTWRAEEHDKSRRWALFECICGQDRLCSGGSQSSEHHFLDFNLFSFTSVLPVHYPVCTCCRSATDRQQGTHVDTLTQAALALMQHALMTQQSYARTGIKWRCTSCWNVHAD